MLNTCSSFHLLMISGAVLSGGKSMRMTEEKGLVLLGGRPLAAHVADAMRSAVDEVVIAVAPGLAPRYREALPDWVAVAEDRVSDRGPLEGLATGLRAAKGEYVIVSTCDTPFLRKGVCDLILSAAVGREGALPVVGGYDDPLHGAYLRQRCLFVFDEVLAQGEHRPRDACRRLDLAMVSEETIRMIDPEMDSFWNINTPEELKAAEESMP